LLPCLVVFAVIVVLKIWVYAISCKKVAHSGGWKVVSFDVIHFCLSQCMVFLKDSAYTVCLSIHCPLWRWVL